MFDEPEYLQDKVCTAQLDHYVYRCLLETLRTQPTKSKSQLLSQLCLSVIQLFLIQLPDSSSFCSCCPCTQTSLPPHIHTLRHFRSDSFPVSLSCVTACLLPLLAQVLPGSMSAVRLLCSLDESCKSATWLLRQLTGTSLFHQLAIRENQQHV